MNNYENFVKFMDNLEVNQKDLVSKLADAEGKVSLFSRELDSAKAMSNAVDGKLKDLGDKLEKNPLDIQLKEEYNIWVIRKSEYHGRADALSEALKVAQKDYAQLIKENSNLDPTPLAEAAVIEMRDEIKRLYSDFCAAINDAQAARKVYLSALNKVNQIKSQGRNTVEAAQKAQSYAKKESLGHVVEFSTLAKPFLISESDISRA
jgi:uncharacterized protein YhdP